MSDVSHLWEKPVRWKKKFSLLNEEENFIIENFEMDWRHNVCDFMLAILAATIQHRTRNVGWKTFPIFHTGFQCVGAAFPLSTFRWIFPECCCHGDYQYNLENASFFHLFIDSSTVQNEYSETRKLEFAILLTPQKNQSIYWIIDLQITIQFPKSHDER